MCCCHVLLDSSVFGLCWCSLMLLAIVRLPDSIKVFSMCTSSHMKCCGMANTTLIDTPIDAIHLCLIGVVIHGMFSY